MLPCRSAGSRARARARRRGTMGALPGAAPRPTPHPSGRGATVPLLRALLDGGLDDPEAVRIGDTAFSGPELLGAASVVADEITERSDPAAPVAVSATASAETVVAVVGALLAGAPVVPVPPDS